MPSAYIVADVTVHDAEQMARYREWSSRAIAEHGAEVMVRGGAIEPLEGDWTPERLVILRFASHAAARTFYDSQTYRHARSLREHAGVMRMVIVDGVA